MNFLFWKPAFRILNLTTTQIPSDKKNTKLLQPVNRLVDRNTFDVNSWTFNRVHYICVLLKSSYQISRAVKLTDFHVFLSYKCHFSQLVHHPFAACCVVLTCLWLWSCASPVKVINAWHIARIELNQEEDA